MGSRKSTCLYLDQDVVETARQAGLNLSKVSENALIRAIEKLEGRRPETGLDSRACMHALSRSLDELDLGSGTRTRMLIRVWWVGLAANPRPLPWTAGAFRELNAHQRGNPRQSRIKTFA
ncbi:MAG: hypothetical protein GWN20_21385 [Phycisphaerae bacterium]|nr:hypothetical protein [Phycisphaerae bacterium]